MGELSWLICLPVAEFFGLTFRLWAAMITEEAFSCQPVISSDKPFWHRDLWTWILAPSQTLPKPDYPFQQQRHVGSGNYWLAVVMVQAASLQITDGSSPYSHFGSISNMTDGKSWYAFFFKADVEMWWPSLSIACSEATTKNTEWNKKQKQKNKESVSSLREADAAVSLIISLECGGW